MQERDLLCITSKVVSIHQGRCIPKEACISKESLIYREASRVIPTHSVPGKTMYIPLQDGHLVMTAGIDESNASGHYILYPKNTVDFACRVHKYLKKRFGLTEVGIIITDSSSKPLKLGTVGIALASYGFQPLLDRRGDLDLFGKTLQVTQINIVDSVSAMSVFASGEGNECTPLVIARNIPHLIFDENPLLYQSILTNPENDLYAPILERFTLQEVEQQEKRNERHSAQIL